MSIPPIPANFRVYFTQNGILTECQWSPFPSRDFDWATVNRPPPLYFGRPSVWALPQAAGVAQPGSSSGDGRRFGACHDIHWPMSSRPTTPIGGVMSGTTAKRKASVDDADSLSVHRSKRTKAPRKDIRGAEADTPTVESTPVAGPSRQPEMAGFDMRITRQGEITDQAERASACAEGEAHSEGTANAQVGDKTEEKREKRYKPPGDGPWICEVHNREFGRWYELDRHMRSRKHEEFAEEFQCERCQDFFSRKDSLQRHQRTACYPPDDDSGAS
ncbi:hypothetical protein HETIRDRAFT_120905 [Heterobasidion irregulare TC 32-1]|uniref:C2H2-type domain-containing protein n=1 Tax=Heterobasidion irregulare (strain TC 32-1) TaxID=747525 RepID=W4JZ31_HETIT|nr:uncharacterized protein HETIRDRAFT_120905 [Heterobasidion irregulare TC 32-1]ETW78330.1 hypothetical protein HETIRDRAFT_120905 [Heterobasidion irregulare TC 32-1]